MIFMWREKQRQKNSCEMHNVLCRRLKDMWEGVKKELSCKKRLKVLWIYYKIKNDIYSK